MIFGECPYDGCDGFNTVPMPDRSPAYHKGECEKCKRVVWTYCSRIESLAYTEQGFLEKFEVDEETKSITEKPAA